MNPMLIGGALNLAGSIPGLVNAIQQGKERKRLLAEGPEGLNQFEQARLGGAQARAASSQVAGYGQELENINQQQANTLGEAQRAGVSSSNMLNALTRLNQQGQSARRNLAIRGLQGQRAAQSELGSIQGQTAGILQNNKRYWEKNLADLDTARKQQIAQFATSPFQGAMAGMRYGQGSTTPTSGTPAPEMMETRTPKLDLRTGGIPNSLLNPVNPTPKPYNPINLNRQPSMLNAAQDGYVEDDFEPNMGAFNPVMNTTLRRSYNPSRFPNTMGIESQVRTNPYYRF